jgi:uncharacterized membrane protein HdeD (DUF308 family)
MSGFDSLTGRSANTGGVPEDWRMPRSRALARAWWIWMLRGAAALIFGAVALLEPSIALGSLILVFAVYLLIDGAFAILASIRAATHHGRWLWLLLEGLAGILVGIWALRLPAVAVTAWIWIMAGWAIISGALMLAAALGVHRGHGNWLLGLGGILSLIWGVLLAVFPIAGAFVLTLWLGAYAIIFGIAMLAFGLRLRSRHATVMV